MTIRNLGVGNNKRIVINQQSTSGRRATSMNTTVGASPDWEIFRDFNSGPDNTGVQGKADGLDDIAGASVYTTEQVYDGARSMKTTITSGSGGFGNWGGAINFTNNLVRYDTLWFDIYAFFPTGYSIITSPLHLKFLRFRTYQSNGTNRGYNDLYIQDDSVSGTGSQQRFKFIREGQDVWYYGGGPGQMTRNTWHRFTVKLVLDSVAKSSGGQSLVRVWQNDSLIISSDDILTLGGATDYMNQFLLHTYWNNDNAPATQFSYYDNIRIAKNGVPSWAAGLPEVPPTPTPTPTRTPTPTLTPTRTPTPTLTPTLTPTTSPSLTPSLTLTPTTSPSLTPSLTPTPTTSPTTGLTFTQVLTDDFNRASFQTASRYATATGYDPMAIFVASGSVYASNPFPRRCLSAVSTSVAIFSDNQEAEITYTTVSNADYAGPAVRVNVADGTGYVLNIDTVNANGRRLSIVSASVVTPIGNVNLTASAGDVYTLRAIGSDISVYRNNVLVDSKNDATYTSGQPGLFYDWQNSRGTRMDNFTASIITGVPPASPTPTPTPTRTLTPSLTPTPTPTPSIYVEPVWTAGPGANAPSWEGKTTYPVQQFATQLPVHFASADANGFKGFSGFPNAGNEVWLPTRVTYPTISTPLSSSQQVFQLLYPGQQESITAEGQTTTVWRYARDEYTNVGIRITGTWTGTLSFETSTDGITWVPKSCYNYQTSTSETSTTVNSTKWWNANSTATRAAYDYFRVRATAPMTGTANVSVGMAGGQSPANASFGSLTGDPTRIYMRVGFRTSENWTDNGQVGTKLIFFTQQNVGSARTNHYVNLTNGGEGAAAKVYPSINIQYRDSALTLPASQTFSHGQWHDLEVILHAGTAENSDGIAQVWMDGIQVMNRNDVMFFNSSSLTPKFTSFWLDPTFGGGSPPPANNPTLQIAHWYYESAP